jgi:CRP/FNR family cyclic AMP-dependent transcriptional regulator
MARKRPEPVTVTGPAFSARAFLDSAPGGRTIVRYARGETIFMQGDASGHVHYIRSGGVKMSVVSDSGREAVVAMLGPGDFFGEGCLAGQPFRTGSATAIRPSAVLPVARRRMAALLHRQRAMSDCFITHMLTRNVRLEEDLIDQLFDASELRLARTLLTLARYGKRDEPARMVLRIAQERLAHLVGATRPQVSILLDKFRKLGFIEHKGGFLRINRSLLMVVLNG